MLAEDGEKQKERFATSQQDTGGQFFPEHVRRDHVEMVLAPGRVGQRLHKTSDRNLKCFTAFFLRSLSRRFTQIRTVSKREAEKFIADYCKLIHNAFFFFCYRLSTKLARTRINMIQEAAFNITYLSWNFCFFIISWFKALSTLPLVAG